MLVPCTMQGMRIRGIFSFLGKRISPFDPQEKGPTLQASSSKNFNACRLHCPQRGAAAFEAAIRFASASTTRCRSAHLAEVQPNFRLPPVSTMRRAPAMPHSVGSLSPDKRHSRLTIVRRGCNRCRIAGIHGEAMYTAPTLRSACSPSSYRLPMCGVKGRRPLRSLGGPRGPFSHVREWPPFPYPPRVWGKCSTTYKWSISAHSTACTSSRCRRGRDRCGRSSGPCGAAFSPCRRRRWRRRCRRPRARA